MLKKIFVFIIGLLCFIPTISFANDAGPILDTEDKMSIEFELKSREAQIGGTLDFTLTLSNNSPKPISWLMLRRVFKDTALTEDINVFENIPELKAGEKKVLFLSASIPQNVYWYKKGNSYYTDFYLYFEYLAWETYEDSVDGGWKTYYFYKSDPVPIKLTNVYDGTEILKLESVEKENVFYFGGNSNFGDTIEYMTSKVNSALEQIIYHYIS